MQIRWNILNAFERENECAIILIEDEKWFRTQLLALFSSSHPAILVLPEMPPHSSSHHDGAYGGGHCKSIPGPGMEWKCDVKKSDTENNFPNVGTKWEIKA